MKQLINILLLVSALNFSSCGTIYYFHTAADSNIKTDQPAYVYENDTVRITYDFWENNGRMAFTVYNKLNIPIFIDWKNSALIINENKYPYWIDQEVRHAHSAKTVSSGVFYGVENSVAIKDERVSSVPPQTKIPKVSIRLRKSTKPAKGYTMSFRNYLALSTSEDVKSDVYVDNKFHVTTVEEFQKLPTKNPKEFYSIQ